MRPLMTALGRFKTDSVQETHPWHIQNVDHELIDSALGMEASGQKETISGRLGPIFHMFGGWKNYVLLEAEPPFHIGWIYRQSNKKEVAQSAINRLLLTEPQVRMLAGPKGSKTLFFATKPDGQQIQLQKTGQGVLGDKQFPGTRLL